MITRTCRVGHLGWCCISDVALLSFCAVGLSNLFIVSLKLTLSSTFVRPQQEELSFGLYNPDLKTAGGGSEGHTGPRRPQNHQGRHSQSFQGSHTQTSSGTHSQVFQEHNQDFHNPYIQLTPELRPTSSQEWRDSGTTVQSRGDRSRYSMWEWLLCDFMVK